MIKSILIILCFPWQVTAPPDSLDLATCYSLVKENYPVVRKINLQQEITDLRVSLAETAKYPQVMLDGKATYQSEVTEFSSPGGEGGPVISKDQYEVALEVDQSIYNGGMTGVQQELEKQQGQVEQLTDEVTLHQLRAQINEVYFGILLAQEQQHINSLQASMLKEQLTTVSSRVRNGVLLPGQQNILEAELVRTAQDSVGIRENILTGRIVLSRLIGKEITAGTVLKVPHPDLVTTQHEDQRPELQLLDSRARLLDQQRGMIDANRSLKISAFGRAAYGRPGNLNFLNNTFHDYYMVGLRLHWDLWNNINASKEIQALDLSQEKIRSDRDAFELQLDTRTQRLSNHIEAVETKISQDRKIIQLREQVVDESASQMNNGVVTATEYVTELNRTSQARLALVVHEIELSKTKIEYLTEWGESIGQNVK